MASHLPPLAAIVAMASNRVIGKDNKLPWHLPEDLKFFKRTTLGHPVLMGRRTFESIGRPLPGRRNVVLSHTMAPQEGIEVIRSIDALQSDKLVFLIGGAQLFETLLPSCQHLYLTWIEKPYEGDVVFPSFEHLFPNYQVLGAGEGLEFRLYQRQPY